MGRVYRTGAEIASLRTTPAARVAEAVPLLTVQRWLGNVDVSSGSPLRGRAEITADQQLLATLAIGLLQRGSPTFSSPAVERALLDSIDAGSGLTGSYSESVARGIATKLEGGSPEQWGALLLGAAAAGHPAAWADPALPFGSDAERGFFERHGRRLLGTGLGLLVPQRPLPSMLPPDLVEGDGSLTEQRVDFALESPGGTRVVI